MSNMSLCCWTLSWMWALFSWLWNYPYNDFSHSGLSFHHHWKAKVTHELLLTCNGTLMFTYNLKFKNISPLFSNYSFSSIKPMNLFCLLNCQSRWDGASRPSERRSLYHIITYKHLSHALTLLTLRGLLYFCQWMSEIIKWHFIMSFLYVHEVVQYKSINKNIWFLISKKKCRTKITSIQIL